VVYSVPGVIALLPEPFAGRVDTIWRGMTREFGVPRGYPGAVPHVSFHIGTHDVDAGAEAVVERVARETEPFRVYSAGLGVFPGPVVHLTVARAPAAAELAVRLERELAAAGFPSSDAYFTPERWMPHITIAHRNLDGVALGPLLAWLAGQDVTWEIPIESLSLARETEDGAEILSTFPLGR
jgi:2'-5' RNA ligase